MKSAAQKLRKILEKELDGKRYEHTLGVEFLSAALAMRWGADLENAQLAGLLHDCAKCLSEEKLLSVCEKNDIPISDAERANPGLLHAKAGAHLARTEYGIESKDILDAIRSHTTGRPGMSLLEKIVFVADYIEPSRSAPGRKEIPRLPEMRALAFTDLDAAVLEILGLTLAHLEEWDAAVDPMTRATYEYYLEAKGKRGDP